MRVRATGSGIRLSKHYNGSVGNVFLEYKLAGGILVVRPVIPTRNLNIVQLSYNIT